jgi:hypothetical protein
VPITDLLLEPLDLGPGRVQLPLEPRRFGDAQVVDAADVGQVLVPLGAALAQLGDDAGQQRPGGGLEVRVALGEVAELVCLDVLRTSDPPARLGGTPLARFLTFVDAIRLPLPWRGRVAEPLRLIEVDGLSADAGLVGQALLLAMPSGRSAWSGMRATLAGRATR